MTDIAPPLSACGQLKQKDIKRAVRHLRQSEISLTTFYYAGATAPIISSAMGFVARSTFTNAHFTPYWTQLLGAIIAAMAGICWFVIFLRWTYSPGKGRGTELSQQTKVEITNDHVIVERGAIKSIIGWAAVKSVRTEKGFTTIEIDGADAVIVPSKWFQDEQSRLAFQGAVSENSPI